MPSYRDKLNTYEVQPPKAAWNAIAEELAINKDLLPLSDKLFNFEVSPPIDNWNVIVNSIETGNRLNQKFPLKKRNHRPFYYIMIAASVIGVVVAAFLYLNQVNNSNARFTTIQTPKTPQSELSPEEPSIGSAPMTDESGDITESATEAVPRIKRNHKGPLKVLQNAKVKNPLFLENGPGIMIAARPIRNANGDIIQNTDLLNNPDKQYISITGPNGQQTKISSKFLHLLLFINDDNDEDEVDSYFDKNFLQSLIWKSRFHEWRNEIINTSFVPSSTNFMDILEFRDLIMKDRE